MNEPGSLTLAQIDYVNIFDFSLCSYRKAFLHWYLGEGMDEAEFSEAENNSKFKKSKQK